MNLEEMKLQAQDAFVQKKITQPYITAFSPEKMLKVMAVITAAKQVREDLVLDTEVPPTPSERSLMDAFDYLDGENNETPKPKIIL